MATTKVVFSPAMWAASAQAAAVPSVVIVDGDMFAHARTLARDGKRVALHNFANNRSPGLLSVRGDGSHMWHTNTQEEQLLRASTLADGKTFLPLDLYPISTPGAVAGLLTPDVKFTRGTRDGVLLPVGEHYVADVVTCAAPMRPRLVGAEYAPGVEEEVVRHMVLVLNMAKDADVLVTGLWGCGAFCHPIKASLRAWKRALHGCSAAPRAVHFCYKKDNLTMLMSADEESASVMEILRMNSWRLEARQGCDVVLEELNKLGKSWSTGVTS